MVYCATLPMRMSTGLVSKMRKSSVESVQPIVSMIRPRMTEARCPCCTQAKVSGKKKATTAMRMIKALVYFASQRLAVNRKDNILLFR